MLIPDVSGGVRINVASVMRRDAVKTLSRLDIRPSAIHVPVCIARRSRRSESDSKGTQLYLVPHSLQSGSSFGSGGSLVKQRGEKAASCMPSRLRRRYFQVGRAWDDIT
ncbi:uncharacterized protein PITG_12329 [Phytophthora infestans T30-4]|uniref:Uncharacterized protein n=1 Tax=Phytophthora infestans (strain T30-4) TaxID=403677 RepID=D0NJL7_PHYIT|nr:uncharacterized protein PITG_12329 [Phytophthora infestans T30-4]EEY59735.1 hypothetical protein PITG_12329 [Phytophthora infestans T30-4]|eukprot:XP_002900928.1 hypothetical protein PITG_12329 [Phytophthora infestans T30-4]